MTPEEKAEELFLRFYNDPLWFRKGDAKTSAIICVDEIIAALNKVVDDSMHVDDASGSIGGANYYQQVKEAIQKL